MTDEPPNESRRTEDGDVQPAAGLNGLPAAVGGRGRGRTISIGVIGVVALGAAAVGAFLAFGGKEAAAAEVTLQSLGSSGSDAFSVSVAPPPSATLADFAANGPPAGPNPAGTETTVTATGYRSADGSVPGVFGGTLDELACDAGQLVAFLSAEPGKAAAWASTIGINDDDIPAYVQGLTAANLGSDTRVLDNGFTEDAAIPRETVLQRGSAVLVDARGVPRVNCYSGNPLLNPTVVENEVYAGEPWSSFEVSEVLVVSPAAADASEFVLFDVGSGALFVRPAGTSGGDDQAVEQAANGATAEATGGATRDLSDAVAIEFDNPVADEVTPDRDEALFEFEAPDGATLTLTVTNDRASIGRIALAVRSGGEEVTFFRVPAGGSEEYSFTLDHDAGGLFEIVVTEGPGAFELMVGSEIQSDAGQGGDAGDDFATAFEIASGRLVDGFLAGVDKGDRYVIEIEGAPALTLTQAASRSSEARVAFTLEIAGEQLYFGRLNPGADDSFSLLLGPEDDGLLEITVTEGPADYLFTADLVDQNDGGQPGDASGELVDARRLDLVIDVSGEVGDRDKGDLYLFEATAGELTIDVSVDPAAAGTVAVELLGPDGNSITFFRVQPGAQASEPFHATAGETYQLRFSEGRGTYSVSVS